MWFQEHWASTCLLGAGDWLGQQVAWTKKIAAGEREQGKAPPRRRQAQSTREECMAKGREGQKTKQKKKKHMSKTKKNKKTPPQTHKLI